MPYRIVLWSLVLAALVSTGVRLAQGVAQDPAPVPAPPVPATPITTPYTPPEARAVLDGTAPLRVLVLSRLTMLAWKGEGEVRATSLVEHTRLYTARAGEQVGMVRQPDASCWLRQDGKNFCALPAAVRLESDKPIKVWTATPDTWTTFAAPLVITPTANATFGVARELPLEEYLRNVVPSEMPASFHPQALRAQAVIARTYALWRLGRHSDDGADLCANEHCQMFIDTASKRTKEMDRAIADTRGLILLYGDKPAVTYYHANCGGVTDDAGLLWGPEYAQPYLTGVSDLACGKTPAMPEVLAAADNYCKASNSTRWSRTFTAAEIDALVRKNLPSLTNDPTAKIAHVTNLAVEERTPNGRVARLRVDGEGCSFVVYGDQVRWLFGTGAPGPNGLWSTLCELTLTRDAAGKLTGCTFRGAGHGIGLCQWGADGRARAGQSYRDILRAYYPGTQLSDAK